MPSLFNMTTTLVNDYIIAKGDSGASHHYTRPEDLTYLQNITLYHSPSITLPDNVTLPLSHQGHLPLSNDLSADAQ